MLLIRKTETTQNSIQLLLSHKEQAFSPILVLLRSDGLGRLATR
jgi:hypothetical protein